MGRGVRDGSWFLLIEVWYSYWDVVFEFIGSFLILSGGIWGWFVRCIGVVFILWEV